MIHPDQIPDGVVEAAAMAFAYHEGYTWGSSGLDHDAILETARAAIAAALNAWPGEDGPIFPDKDGYLPGIFLPLPQEKQDD
jgi:hypothetical protein